MAKEFLKKIKEDKEKELEVNKSFNFELEEIKEECHLTGDVIYKGYAISLTAFDNLEKLSKLLNKKKAQVLRGILKHYYKNSSKFSYILKDIKEKEDLENIDSEKKKVLFTMDKESIDYLVSLIPELYLKKTFKSYVVEVVINFYAKRFFNEK